MSSSTSSSETASGLESAIDSAIEASLESAIDSAIESATELPLEFPLESEGEARRARRFLGLALLMIVTVEVAFSLFTEADRGRHEVDHRVATIAGIAEAPRTVLLSDSVSFGVLDLVEPAPGVLDLSSNRSVTVVGNTLLARRLFKNMRDRGLETEGLRVVYALGPESLQSDLNSTNFLESYFTSVFTQPDEIADVQANLNRPQLTAAMERGQREVRWQFPSHLRRGLLIYPLSGALRRLKTSVLGTEALAAEVSPAFEAKLQKLLPQTQFNPSEATRTYLGRLWSTCQENGARLVILLPPMPPSVVTHWERNGYLPSLRDWLRRFTEEHDGTRVVEAPAWDLGGDTAFYDGVHFLPRAKLEWGRRLRAFLIDPASEALD